MGFMNNHANRRGARAIDRAICVGDPSHLVTQFVAKKPEAYFQV